MRNTDKVTDYEGRNTCVLFYEPTNVIKYCWCLTWLFPQKQRSWSQAGSKLISELLCLIPPATPVTFRLNSLPRLWISAPKSPPETTERPHIPSESFSAICRSAVCEEDVGSSTEAGVCCTLWERETDYKHFCELPSRLLEKDQSSQTLLYINCCLIWVVTFETRPQKNLLGT